jgi:hypothetical protein
VNAHDATLLKIIAAITSNPINPNEDEFCSSDLFNSFLKKLVKPMSASENVDDLVDVPTLKAGDENNLWSSSDNSAHIDASVAVDAAQTSENSAMIARMTAAEDSAVTLTGRVAATEAKNIAQDGRLTAAETDATALAGRVATAERGNLERREHPSHRWRIRYCAPTNH